MDFAVKPQDEPCVGTAEPGSVFDKRLEHRLKIEGRTADNFQHFARGGLLFQSFSQVAVACLQFLKQAHVFDSDDCLVSKGGDQLDLLVQ